MSTSHPNNRSALLFEGFESGGHFMKAAIDAPKYAVGFVGPVGIALSGPYAGENLDSFLDPGDGKDLEFAGRNGIDHIIPQHQVFNIFRGDHDSLPPSESLHAADIVETFDLLIDSADRLDIPLLADRAGHGDLLADGQT